MDGIRILLSRCSAFLYRRRLDDDLDAELRVHIDFAIEENLKRGMSEEQARTAALRAFGGVTQTKEAYRIQRGLPFLETVVQDVRYALRQLRKAPSFAIAAILTLALGVGANTAIFSVVDAILLRALPVRNPQRLVIVECPDSHGGYNGFSYPTFEYFRNHNNVMSDMYASSIPERLSVSVNGYAELVRGQVVSGSYYSTLGLNAVLGRTIDLRDDAPGALPVAMISYGYWKRQFNANKDAIGKTIGINGAGFTIIGVTPPNFFGIMVGYSPDLTVSMGMQPQIMANGSLPNDKSTWAVETIGGRMKPGVTLKQARANLDLLFHQTRGTKRQQDKLRIEVTPGSRGLSGIRAHLFQPLIILMTIVGLVLFVACANVANLLLARDIARHHEIAMRFALGATRLRVARQLLTESLVIAILGGTLGSVLAIYTTRLLLALIATGPIPIVINTQVDFRTLGFTGLIALMTAILFGFAPAIRATKVNLIPNLKTSSGTIRRTRNGVELGKALVISQVAVSFLLLMGVGLFVRTLQTLKDVNPGFNPENVLQFTIDPTLAGYKGNRLGNLYKELLEGLESIPGVQAVSASRFAELTPGRSDVSISVSGYVAPPGGNPTVQENLVGPNFFRTMEMPLLLGRDFTIKDDVTMPDVAVISEAAALRYFGSQNPIGANVDLLEPGSQVQIVGVVKDAKYHSLREHTTPMIFVPFLQLAPERTPRLTFEVRTTVAPENMIAAVRQRIRRINENLPMADVKTLTKQIDQSLMQERLVATLSTLFAFLGLALACVGLYGIMAYDVARRTNEIGIRMVLGAQKNTVLRLVVGRGMLLALVGVGIGIVGALGLTRLLSKSLYGVKPTDPLTFVIVSIVLSGMALLACYIPARRAASIDPMQALRAE